MKEYRSSSPDCRRCPHRAPSDGCSPGCAQAVSRWGSELSGVGGVGFNRKVSAFVFESVQNVGGMVEPDSALLRAAVVSFSPLSDKHHVVADVPGDLPPASGDSMATDIIVGQLLENAFKYSPDGGTVCVRARVTGGWIEVTVEDEGIGIADGDH